MKLLHPVALIVLLAGVLAPASGQPAADPASARLAEELSGIRSALDRLVALREGEGPYRQADLLMKRIDLHERRLEPLESRLQEAETEFREYEDHLKMVEQMLEQREGQLTEEIQAGTDTPRSETRQDMDNLRRTRKAVEERMQSGQVRLRELQDAIAKQHEEIEILDEMLAELLELPVPERR